MEHGHIPDSALAASSTFDMHSVGPHIARARKVEIMLMMMVIILTMMLTMMMSKKRLMLKMMMSAWTRVGADEPCYFRNLVTRNRPATQLN